jgi:hypothetical protein
LDGRQGTRSSSRRSVDERDPGVHRDVQFAVRFVAGLPQLADAARGRPAERVFREQRSAFRMADEQSFTGELERRHSAQDKCA